jgi:hypothetical protein
MSDNAYEPPMTVDTLEGVVLPCEGVWRDDAYVVARRGIAQFPTSCIVCGRDESCQPMACKVRRRPGVLQFLVPITGIFSPSVTIRPSVCALHRNQERNSRWLGHTLLLIAVGLVVVPLMAEVPGGTSFFVALSLPVGYAWVYYRIFRPRILWAQQIRRNDAWLEEVHESVLNSVPLLPAER